ncbi:MAG: HAD hydrolase-like protein [Spirochaetes bacterium]|nr:HAD hydrolase-like protein [Spirochaetota bacterium]
MNFFQDYLFLFDIDGTILDTNGDGKKAFLIAFEEIWGIKISKRLNFLGSVDLAVYQEICRRQAINYPFCFTKWEEFQSCYANQLELLSGKNDWTLFPYCRETLKYFEQLAPLALVTGNIYQGAQIKLAHYELSHFFPDGGFGEKVYSRSQLVFQAIENASRYYKKDFEKEKIFLIGDTIRDVESSYVNEITPILIDHRNKNRDTKKQYPELLYFTHFKEVIRYFDSFFSERMN